MYMLFPLFYTWSLITWHFYNSNSWNSSNLIFAFSINEFTKNKSERKYTSERLKLRFQFQALTRSFSRSVFAFPSLSFPHTFGIVWFFKYALRGVWRNLKSQFYFHLSVSLLFSLSLPSSDSGWLCFISSALKLQSISITYFVFFCFCSSLCTLLD